MVVAHTGIEEGTPITVTELDIVPPPIDSREQESAVFSALFEKIATMFLSQNCHPIAAALVLHGAMFGIDVNPVDVPLTLTDALNSGISDKLCCQASYLSEKVIRARTLITDSCRDISNGMHPSSEWEDVQQVALLPGLQSFWKVVIASRD
jgi:hypothetical protein